MKWLLFKRVKNAKTTLTWVKAALKMSENHFKVSENHSKRVNFTFLVSSLGNNSFVSSWDSASSLKKWNSIFWSDFYSFWINFHLLWNDFHSFRVVFHAFHSFESNHFTLFTLKRYSLILTTSFYDMNQKIWTRKAYFQNFSWFQFHVFKLCMIMCVSLLP